MSHLTVAITVVKTLTFLLGGAITYVSWQAYRRTGARPLRALAAGFAVVTVGGVLGGVTDLVAPAFAVTGQRTVLLGVFVNSVLTLVGFGVITYSLYAE